MFQCRGVSKPCCGQEALPTSGILMGQEYTCAVFGSGLCEPTSSFRNIQKHLELVEKLNDTNFEALKIEYETDLQKAITERAKGKLDVVIVDKDEPELETGCISHHVYVSISMLPLALNKWFEHTTESAFDLETQNVESVSLPYYRYYSIVTYRGTQLAQWRPMSEDSVDQANETGKM